MLCKFPDDTKIGDTAVTENDTQILRADLSNLAKWATEW